MVERTLSEIQATAMKAAKGAEYGWGMAQEAGNAAKVLSRHGIDGITQVAELLRVTEYHEKSDFGPDISKQNCTSPKGKICSLSLGTLISDMPEKLVSENGIIAENVIQPFLLVPFLMAVTTDNTGFHVRSSELDWIVLGNTIQTNSKSRNTAHVATVEIIPTNTAGLDLKLKPAIADIDITSWEYLETLAFRTYVPESEESRQRGAG